MVVDSSAAIAVMLLEQGWPELASMLERESAVLAAPMLVEVYVVLSNRMEREVDDAIQHFLSGFNVAVVAFAPDHARLAMSAYDRFGKGRHPAALNFGDCMSYALSKSSGQPLLFVGNDFSKTDITPA